MSRTPRGGFTLIELILALFLAAIIMAGLGSILTPLVRTQVLASSAQTSQLNLAAVTQLIERELRQASLVRQPSPGTSSGALEGCANAAPPTGTEAIDGTRPMSWFAFCVSDGIVYYHSGAGCPVAAAYLCGASPAAAFRWGPSSTSQFLFTRPLAGKSTLVTAVLRASSGLTTARATSAVAFQAPDGGAQ